MFNDMDDYGCWECKQKDKELDRLYDILERVETERDELAAELREVNFRLEGLEK